MTITVEPWVMGVVVAAIVFALVFVALLPTWLFYRGLCKASPMPRVVESVLDRTPREPAKEWPKPTAKCRACGVVNWKISPDESLWVCGQCGTTIDGPRPKVRA